MWPFLVVLLLSIGTLATAQDLAQDAAQDVQWLRLLHYRKGWLSQRSDVAGNEFFLAGDLGRTDAAAELTATLKAFKSAETTPENSHATCRFPARLKWAINKKLIEPATLPKITCPLLERFRARVDPEAVSLVFSSYYLNSPGSAFGHTLFRLHRKSLQTKVDGERLELLDHGIGYAAEVSIDNPVLYAIYGLAGWFRGTFSNLPYYYKVREYNDFDSRDLWSYELNLSDQEIKTLVDHIWEVGGTYFRYYFLTQNCALHLLTVLEAAAPRLNLSSRLPSLYVIPSDSIKILNLEPGLVKKVSYRPSIRARYKNRVDGLSQKELQELHQLQQKPTLEPWQTGLGKDSKARVLDTMLEFVDLKQTSEKSLTDTQITPEKRFWLSARAALGVPSPELQVPVPELERPDLGHGSSRMNFAVGNDSRLGSFARYSMRFALHEPIDPTLGYPQGSQIEFARIDVRANRESPQFEVERVELFRAAAFNPLSRVSRAISWRGALGAVRTRERTCDGCLGIGFEGGGGWTVQWDGPSQHQQLVYLLAEADVRFSNRYNPSDVRTLLGPTLGSLVAFSSQIKSQWEIGWRFPLGLDQGAFWTASGDLRWNISNVWAVGVRYSLWDLSQESTVNGFWYF